MICTETWALKGAILFSAHFCFRDWPCHPDFAGSRKVARRVDGSDREIRLLALAKKLVDCEDLHQCHHRNHLANAAESGSSMKKCRRCAKPATLHITEIRDGNAVAVHLCETCAREYLENSSEGESPSAADDLASKLEELIAETGDSPLVCPHCGISFSEFRENGRFGCPHDYTEFMAELLPLLENIHEDSRHVGKRPRSTVVGTEKQARLIQLRNEQRQAIEMEDYETAARLRDEIATAEQALRGEPEQKPRAKKKKLPETEV
jgi:protein arginine kinase activator